MRRQRVEREERKGGREGERSWEERKLGKRQARKGKREQLGRKKRHAMYNYISRLISHSNSFFE